MYPNITMPQEDNQNLNDVLTTMATGAIPAEAEDYTASEDIMDISSYHASTPNITTHQHAIPTSVITPTSLNNVGWLGANQNSIHGGGFVPPSVSTSNGSYAVVTTRPTNGISVVNTMPRSMGGRVAVNELDLIRISSGSQRRRIKDEELSPEERDKRRVRRERNKLAAAKCRQRRVDHTNTLVEQTEDWEEKNSTLEQEITKLQQQKEQLEFILEAHKAMCSKTNKLNGCNKDTTTTTTTSSTSTSLDTPVTEVVTPTSVFNSLSTYEVLVPGETMDASNGNNANVTIKQEPGTEPGLRSPGAKGATLLQL